MKVAVVGGGLAGLAAALDLLDAGHDVTLLEARPTLGGAVQTLPERDGDPSPPPDNGQHVALGCFEEYLRFLERIGSRGSYSRGALSLPVIGEDGSVAAISRNPLSILRYRHLPPGERLRVVRALLALRSAEARPEETFADVLRRLGQSRSAIARFWDVFIRPALNLPCAAADGAVGVFTVRTALLGRARDSELVLPTAPLGSMHGGAARRALGSARTGARVVELQERAARARRRARGGGRVRRRPAAARGGRAPRRARAGRRVLADRLRAPALRPAAAPALAGSAPRLAGALGLRPRRPHRAGARRAAST